jgi:hypothetical protein
MAVDFAVVFTPLPLSFGKLLQRPWILKTVSRALFKIFAFPRDYRKTAVNVSMMVLTDRALQGESRVQVGNHLELNNPQDRKKG